MMDLGLPVLVFSKLEWVDYLPWSMRASRACTDVGRLHFSPIWEPLLTRQIEHSMKGLQPPRPLSGRGCGSASNSHAA